jgi:hypothetical protein
MDNIKSIVSVQIAPTTESNPDSLITTMDRHLASSIPLGGYGVQQIRDASGKLIEVRPFFDDKVPQGEKAVAVDKIRNNPGVASVLPAQISLSEDFDALLAANYPTPALVGSLAIRANGVEPVAQILPGGFSAPNYLSCLAGAPSRGIFYDWQPALFGLAGLPLTAFKWAVRFKFPANFTGRSTGGSTFFRFSWGSPLFNFQAAWAVTSNVAVPPATIPAHGLTNLVGPVPAIPVDGAWHLLEFEEVSYAAGVATIDVRLDGVSNLVTRAQGVQPMSPNATLLELHADDGLDVCFDDFLLTYTYGS